MNYHQLKAKHQKGYNELSEAQGVFYAFSDNQFKEGLQKLGLTEETAKDKLTSIGGGGFMLSDKVQSIVDYSEKTYNEMQEALKGEEFLLEALTYELCNHEYCITGDSRDALQALGLEAKDIPQEVFRKARMEASKDI
tara:strand:+ start:58 stop:471 length:414 start_codon:yes stop_codon:yes gene_type:complete